MLVLDQTHGGDRIGREHRRLGHDVTLVDVYGTMSAEERRALRDEGIRCEVRAPPEKFDLAIVPVHCPDRFLADARYDERITHHEAVGRLVRFKMPVIEVTGVSGKTSACHIIAHMLSMTGRTVLLHTSRGDLRLKGDKIEVIKEKTSIAPASLIELAGLEGFDVAVLEESLGGCGIGDVCCITNLNDDYGIAGGTRKALDGKVQMVRLAKKKVVFPERERDLWSPYLPEGVEDTTFGSEGDVHVEFGRELQLGVPLELRVFDGGSVYSVSLSSMFLAPAYTNAFETSLAAMKALGIDMEATVRSLSSFKGVPGRGEIEREGMWYMVRERNPGVGARSIGWNISILEDLYGISDIGLVIDPVNAKVCEKLDMHAVLRVVAEKHSVKKVYLFERRCGEGRRWPDLERIKNAYEVWGKHKVVLWCTKEGFL